MKKIIYSVLALSALLLSSCNDWLDVSPREQIKSDEIYKTESGYKKVLNGVYIDVVDENLYGKNTTMYFPELLARNFTIPTTAGTEHSLGNYDFTYSSVESLISTIYKNYYTAIAQLNDLIENLDKPGCKFTYDNDKLLRGEALGMRAFLHLDLLRYFGPVPATASDGDEGVPYVTTVTNETSQLKSKTYKEDIDCILGDLNKAEEILGKYDPIVYHSLDSLNHSVYLGKNDMPKDDWQMFRQNRFNYYAVLAAKARLYHWIGDKDKAVEYAGKVLDAKKFTLVNGSTIDNSLDMFQEQIFGLNNPDLQSIVDPLFGANSSALTQTTTYLNKIYESTVNVNDIRYAGNRYWMEKTLGNGAKTRLFFKYTGNDNVKADNKVPLIRLAEMYLIMIEDNSLEAAKPYLSDFRVARALDASVVDNALANESALRSRLELEWRKEFMGEGQMFFYYKLHNVTSFTMPSRFTVPAGGYVIPKPKGQTDFE